VTLTPKNMAIRAEERCRISVYDRRPSMCPHYGCSDAGLVTVHAALKGLRVGKGRCSSVQWAGACLHITAFREECACVGRNQGTYVCVYMYNIETMLYSHTHTHERACKRGRTRTRTHTHSGTKDLAHCCRLGPSCCYNQVPQRVGQNATTERLRTVFYIRKKFLQWVTS